eukprot:15451181-Alexandrium_andersonii.AAC.1
MPGGSPGVAWSPLLRGDKQGLWEKKPHPKNKDSGWQPQCLNQYHLARRKRAKRSRLSTIIVVCVVCVVAFIRVLSVLRFTCLGLAERSEGCQCALLLGSIRAEPDIQDQGLDCRCEGKCVMQDFDRVAKGIGDFDVKAGAPLEIGPTPVDKDEEEEETEQEEAEEEQKTTKKRPSQQEDDPGQLSQAPKETKKQNTPLEKARDGMFSKYHQGQKLVTKSKVLIPKLQANKLYTPLAKELFSVVGKFEKVEEDSSMHIKSVCVCCGPALCHAHSLKNECTALTLP